MGYDKEQKKQQEDTETGRVESGGRMTSTCSQEEDPNDDYNDGQNSIADLGRHRDYDHRIPMSSSSSVRNDDNNDNSDSDSDNDSDSDDGESSTHKILVGSTLMHNAIFLARSF